MFRRRKSRSREHDERQERQGRERRNESSGSDIQARIAALRSVPREQLADAVFLLSMAAKQQSEQIRRSIMQCAEAEFAFDPPRNGDLADYLAEDAVSVV